jgi:ComF family protein
MNIEKQKTFRSSIFTASVSTLYDSFLTLVYPQSCRLCEKSVESHHEGLVCAECWRKTHIFKGKEIICHKCGAFLKNGFSAFQTFCHRCDEDFYDLARAVGFYQKSLLVSILSLKKQPVISKILEELIFSAFKNSPFQDTTKIIPVPLSKIRFTERGFNQAEILAKNLAKQTNLPIDENNLRRVIHTEKHRAGMDRKSRNESVNNAFEVAYPKLIEGENILLIDDVFTSGSTVSNCAKALKDKGANKVYVLTVARAF